MKKRILSVILALCLCGTSQSVACAFQEDSSVTENVSTEEITEGPEHSSDADKDLPEDPALSENVSTEETTEEPEHSGDVDTDLPEDVSTEEITEEPEHSGDVDTDLPEDISTEEITEEPEHSGDVDTDLPEDISTEEITEELDSSEGTEEQTEVFLLSEDLLAEETTEELVTYDDLTPWGVYEAIIALKDQAGYTEGTTWTNDEPYSDANKYYWNGGELDGKRVGAVGCVAFAFKLSDAAFGSLQNRMYSAGAFKFEDIKVGDILRMNTDTHTVIVLEVSDAGVVVAEGNSGGVVRWGRTISKDVVMSDTSHYITRYPDGYILPDDPAANDIIGSGDLAGGKLTWKLTKAGTLTISGSGAMPDYSADEQPWSDNSSKIRKVVIGSGVTSIGSCAFYGSGVLSVEIPASVTTIGSYAFRGSSIVSVAVPSSVKTIGDSAFYACANLRTVTFSEGLETIGQNAFRGCGNLACIDLPASLAEVGDAAFFQCQEMTDVTFAPGSRQVKLGDNLFMQCYKLMNVTLPRNINCIGTEMFWQCRMLAGVEIPQGADSIGERAFASSGVSVIVIPNSVTTIKNAAFSSCSKLTDIYFTGTEAQWNSISKITDTGSALLTAAIHYNYVPDETPDDGSNSDNGEDSSDPDNGNNSGDGEDNSDPGENNPDNGSGDGNTSDNTGSGNDNKTESSPAVSYRTDSDVKTTVETWKPTTPDEIKRYACMGKEAVEYTQSTDNTYQVVIENAMQGPMCFQSFEAVLGDYTIGRTYNIYAPSGTVYSMDQEIQLTLKIPSAIYAKDREYKLICVTEGGQPVIYDDLDSDPGTITIKTNKFYAYALIYKQK